MAGLFRMNLTRGAVVLLTAAVLFGPWYAPAMYSPVSQVISELAAQNTPGNRIMATTFVLVGLAIAADGLLSAGQDHLPWQAVPFVLFGLCFAAAGLFGHRPYVDALPWNPLAHTIHSVIASVSGTVLSIGLGWQAFTTPSRPYRWWTAVLAAVCLIFPLAMLLWPAVQGVTQRLMYALIFWGWFWPFHPLPSRA